VTATPVIGAPKPPALPEERKAAKQLESFFLRQFLTEARPKSSMLDGGFAGDTFRDMLDSALADSMAASGGFGLTNTFETALGGTPEASKAIPSSTTQALAAGFPLVSATTRAPIAIPDHAHLPGEMVRPAVGRFSSRFGQRLDPIDHVPKGHNGLDIAAREGTPVVAALDGTVKRAGPAGTYGNLVVIEHPDGSETRYAHLSTISVKPGQHLVAGQPLGAVGTTGRSTGPHLHFEVRRDGRPVDPWPLLSDAENAGTP